MAIYHIGKMNPDTHPGGVAQFARDLKSAIPELKFIHFEGKQDVPEWRMSQMYALPLLSQDDIVIADGFYGFGLGGHVKWLIVVCHGTYAGWIRDFLRMPSENRAEESFLPYLMECQSYQERAYRECDSLVAVSTASAEDLWSFYRLESQVILNGVDTDLFCPPEHMRDDQQKVVEVAGDDIRKGSDIITKLRSSGNKIHALGYDGAKHDRWKEFQIALLPSRSEGCQYAALEAMATGLKIVAYRSGVFRHDVPSDLIFGTFDFYWRKFQSLLDEARESDTRQTRDWVLNHASMERFRAAWHDIVQAPAGGE